MKKLAIGGILLAAAITFDLSYKKIPEGFALIPAGSYQMGDALDNERDAPVHEVTVSAFYIAKYEVTKALWDEVRIWGRGHGYPNLEEGEGKAATHPVDGINWYSMMIWCNARSERDGFTPCYYTDAAKTIVYRRDIVKIDNTMVKWTANGYRLPTEAEWEKAARGGLHGKRFPWGDRISHTLANFQNNGFETYQTGIFCFHPTYKLENEPYTAPVGSFPPNGYGLYDVTGNVSELCWDRYENYPSGPQADPLGAASGEERVYRGGDWFSNANACRVAQRCCLRYSISRAGFRPIRSTVP